MSRCAPRSLVRVRVRVRGPTPNPSPNRNRNPEQVRAKELGNAAFSSGQHATAIKHFTLAIRLDKSNHILYRLGLGLGCQP